MAGGGLGGFGSDTLISLEQLIQNVNNLAQVLSIGVGKLSNGVFNYYTAGAALTSGSPVSIVPVTSSIIVTRIAVVLSTGGPSTATATWLDDSASATYPLITAGVVPTAVPLEILPAGTEMALDADDEINITAASANQYAIINYREKLL